jgi:hypothetical protein
MNQLTKNEKEFLNSMQPYIKEGINKQPILNIYRIIEKRLMYKGKTSWSVDQQWTDDQLK